MNSRIRQLTDFCGLSTFWAFPPYTDVDASEMEGSVSSLAFSNVCTSTWQRLVRDLNGWVCPVMAKEENAGDHEDEASAGRRSLRHGCNEGTSGSDYSGIREMLPDVV